MLFFSKGKRPKKTVDKKAGNKGKNTQIKLFSKQNPNIYLVLITIIILDVHRLQS